MVEAYQINFKLILFITIAVGIDRILSKTDNYKVYKRILIILALIGFLISLIYGDDTINNTMSVILIGYIFDFFRDRKKDIK